MYASLLMSLLAAFVAMLGKQWLNRYLRHTGGSMVERGGERQRKFDGLEKWPFHLFIESLPIMLQIALLFLTCGLSRYVWSINTSVACVVIFFTVLSVLFYIGIVIAGTSSYECPFQTPVSTALRSLRESGRTQMLLASLSPHKVIQFIYTTWRNTQKVLVILLLPNTTSLIYATWMDTLQWFILTSQNMWQSLLSWEFSLSSIMTSIHGIPTRVGHTVIILLLQADQTLGNAKQRLAQGIQRLRHVGLLPTTIEDVHHQLLLPQNSPGLQLPVRNLGALQQQNMDDAHCVSWVLQNITDPEAIDSAIRLAGTIQWFNGDPNHGPPLNSIITTFEACFDSTKQLYPGMRDRAYFSARAILQINMSARAQPHEHTSNYPIPTVSSSSSPDLDPDLHNILCMLEHNFGPGRPILDFPRVSINSHAHLLWMSNLFVGLTHTGPNPTLKSYQHYLGAATANHKPMIANALLMWYILLGGDIKEETFWAIDKSYVKDLLSSLLTNLMPHILVIHWTLYSLTYQQE